MPLTDAAVFEELRARLGAPSESEMPDTFFPRAIRVALREVSRHAPITYEVNFTTTTGLSDYFVPPGALSVLSVAERVDATKWWDPIFLHYATAPTSAVAQVNALHAAKLDRAADRGTTGEMLPGGIVRLSPTPPAGGPLVLLLAMERSLADITSDLEEPFMLFALAECLKMLALKRDRRIRAVPTAVGVIRFDDGTGLMNAAKVYQRDAIGRLGGLATAIGAG